jgi:mannose-6-phosphate isomerase-like protein (cupin superfamily)
MEIKRRDLLGMGAALGIGIAANGVLGQEGGGGASPAGGRQAAPTDHAAPAAGRTGARGGRPPAREVWAAKPIPPTPYVPPNRLIWRLSDILAAHKGQQDWTQHVVRTRDYDAYWISMGPGEKTKTQFYSDDRVTWVVQSGQTRFTIEGQEPFVAAKSFLIDVPARTYYSLETVGDAPSLRFEVRPAGEMPSYPASETPTPVPGWTYIKALLNERGSYDDAGAPPGLNKPYLDFQKDVVEADGKSSQFVLDGHTSVHIIRGPGGPTPPPTNLGHFHENMVEFWIVLEGKLDFLVEGEKLVTGEIGDVIHAPNERWHRATFHEGGMATRLAITPRQLGGQSHYMQVDQSGGSE